MGSFVFVCILADHLHGTLETVMKSVLERARLCDEAIAEEDAYQM